MKSSRAFTISAHPLVVILILAITSISCSLLASGPFNDSFDSAGNWGSGSSPDVEGQVNDGVYEMLVKSNHGLYLATAGKNFGDGVYEVEASQIDGPLNNGYGMLFRVDESTDSFYVFEISGDGYVWIGYCSNLCETEAVSLVGGDWFRSPAVNTGLQVKNRLRVEADGPQMTFFVNGVELGRTSDNRISDGDIAVMVEALGQPGVRVAFDNFSVEPK